MIASVQTSFGPVPVWGRIEGRPLLFVIRGAYPEPNHLAGMAEALPHLDVLLVHLPGMHSPGFAEPSLRAFASAFDEVFDALCPAQPINVLGVSLGGTTTLALRNPRLRSIIALDPPLETAGLWPLRQAADDAWGRAVIGPDYASLLDGLTTPTRIILGTEPLEPERRVSRMPSLVCERDRSLYDANPKCGVWTVGNCGHNIPRDAQDVMFRAIYRWLGEPPQAAAAE